jgi:transmembrane sensor
MENQRVITADELLLDERFLNWARGGTADAHVETWITALRESSEVQEQEVVEALLLYRQIVRPERSGYDHQFLRQQLMASIDREEVYTPGRDAMIHLKKTTIFSLGFLAIVGITFFLFMLSRSQSPKELTGDGKDALLEDGTKVKLSSQSTLTYQNGFASNKTREVWIKGEANFQVTHQENNQPFIVHTAAFDIEVTGTKFIVNNQEDLVSVLLQEGSVQLHFPGGDIVKMKPGDYFSISQFSKTKLRDDQVNPTQLEKNIVFENTSIDEVAREIEARYRVAVKVLSPELNSKLITGIIPNDNLAILLKALESAMDCVIITENNTIYIKSLP